MIEERVEEIEQELEAIGDVLEMLVEQMRNIAETVNRL